MTLPAARTKTLVAIGLVVLMAVTRIHHFGVGAVLPDASVAVFFLAGLYLGAPLWLAAFMVEAAVLDQLAFSLAGVSDWCFTPAYAALIPANAALFFAGRGAGLQRFDAAELGNLAARLAIGVTGFFLVSNLGFWAASGYFAGMSLADYSVAVAKYLPAYLATGFAYVAAALALQYGLARRGAVAAAR